MACTCPRTSCQRGQSCLQHKQESQHHCTGQKETHTGLVSLTSQRTLSWRGVLPDKREELVLGLLQGDLAVPHCLSQARLKHKEHFGSCPGFGKLNHFTSSVTEIAPKLHLSFHPSNHPSSILTSSYTQGHRGRSTCEAGILKCNVIYSHRLKGASR